MSDETVNDDKEMTLECPRHGKYTPEKDCFCPSCQKEIEEEKRLEEENARKQLSIEKWRSMNIDEKYFESTFDNFKAYNDELSGFLETCRAFAKNPDGKLVMLGKNGNGKTHLAVSVLKEIGGAIYTAFEIGIKLRQSYNGGTKEHEVFDELCRVPLLVIDEVEKIKDSESKQNWMSYVIGKRYNRMLPIIIIANCHSQKDCMEREKPCPHCFEYHLENDILSRIAEDGIIMKFNSGDYRKKIRKDRFGNQEGEANGK